MLYRLWEGFCDVVDMGKVGKIPMEREKE